jgi:hypothetical protein
MNFDHRTLFLESCQGVFESMYSLLLLSASKLFRIFQDDISIEVENDAQLASYSVLLVIRLAINL